MPTRRSVVRTAAWTVPAVTVVTAAPAFASTSGVTYTSVTRTVTYNSVLSGNLDVTITSTVPVTVPAGATIAPATITSRVPVAAAQADTLRNLFQAQEVSGTSSSTSTFAGAFTGSSTSALTIARTAVPPTGGFVNNATGSGQPVTAGAGKGAVTITLGAITTNLIVHKADGTTQPLTMQLNKVTGVDYTLHTFQVV